MAITLNGTTGIVSPAIDVTTPVTVADGGTGLSSVGTSGNVLTSNGTSWVSSTPAAGGKLLQVVQGTYTTQQSTTSTSFVASGVAASITPSNASNKVLVEVSLNGVTTNNSVFYTIYRNSTNLGGGSNSCFAVCTSGGDTQVSMRFLDSPSTTSSTTYTVYYKVGASTTGYTTTQGTSVINLSEIAA